MLRQSTRDAIAEGKGSSRRACWHCKGNLQRALTVEGHCPFSIFLKGVSGSHLENKYLRLRKSRGRETGESITGERGWWLDREVGSKECIKGMTSVYLGGDQVSLVDWIWNGKMEKSKWLLSFWLDHLGGEWWHLKWKRLYEGGSDFVRGGLWSDLSEMSLRHLSEEARGGY